MKWDSIEKSKLFHPRISFNFFSRFSELLKLKKNQSSSFKNKTKKSTSTSETEHRKMDKNKSFNHSNNITTIVSNLASPPLNIKRDNAK